MDDVYVIVLFTTFISMIQGNGVSVICFVNIPISIAFGILIGFISGWMLSNYFEKVHIRDTIKILIILSWSFILVAIEDALHTPITFSALIAIMFIGIALQKIQRRGIGPVICKIQQTMGSCGDIVLTVAVLAIVLTAPLGAFAIDLSYKKMLERERNV